MLHSAHTYAQRDFGSFILSHGAQYTTAYQGIGGLLTMHQPQACPTWLLTGLLLLGGLALTQGRRSKPNPPRKKPSRTVLLWSSC